jgi:hypothetical protein
LTSEDQWKWNKGIIQLGAQELDLDLIEALDAYNEAVGEERSA